VFLVLASKRIRYNQKKTDKVGFLKNHAPIVGCRTNSSLECSKPVALMSTFLAMSLMNFQNSLVLISGNFHHFFGQKGDFF
jgi:hypothetical protein